MTTSSLPDVLSPRVQEAVATAAAGAESLAHEEYDAQWCRNCWQQVIDRTLIEWGRNPSVLEDDGISPPTGASIDAALRIAGKMREYGIAPPLRVVPTGDGGISFERGNRQWSEMIEVNANGSAECFEFEEARLVHRAPFPL